jgi:mono/diheme cytochrome c family protein
MPIRFKQRTQAIIAISGLLALVLIGTAGLLAQSPKKTDVPTFYRDVLPILQQHCQVCHRDGGIAPIPFETYVQTRTFAEAIRRATQDRSMPPWFADARVGHFSNDPSLSSSEIDELAAWVEGTSPAGNSKDAPRARKWASGWSIPQPDLVLKMPRAVPLPASGDIEYTYEIVPTNFKEDRWVRASEILPSLRANVHHAVVYVRPPESDWMRHAPVGVPFTASTLTNEEDRRGAHWTDSDVLLVYAPGSSPDSWPEKMAKFIPAGSDLVFQMHYTANGHAAGDQSGIGLIFSKRAPEQRVLTLQLTNDHLVIPPGAPDYRVEARGTLPNDATLLSFFPHMHLRGKRFEYNLIRRKTSGDGEPDYDIEPLLRVNYHFHWQMSYKLAEPRALPAGTELQAVAWFDNSKANPHNPDPDAEVRWGEQTYDEMMVGFFDVAVPANVDKQHFFIRKSGNSEK